MVMMVSTNTPASATDDADREGLSSAALERVVDTATATYNDR